MKPIHKRHSILSLAIAALLSTGIAGYSESGYALGLDKSAASDASKSADKDEDKDKDDKDDDGKDDDGKDDDGKGGGDSGKDSGDSNARGKDDEAKKITICHVPKGNPGNAHTIHIGYSAWKAHKENHGGDYLGSCTQAPAISTTDDEVRIITGCTGSYRKTLITKVQSYYEPIVVSDDALKDDKDSENLVAAVSQCLSAGDSSDSGKGDSSKKGKGDSGKGKSAEKDDKDDKGDSGKKSAGKGYGHDSVSDSGKHHYISGCKNKEANDSDSSDSQHYGDSEKDGSKKSYHKSLKGADSTYDKAKGHGDSSGIIVSDSSLDDSGKEGHDSGDVWAKYKACLADGQGKIDSAKVKSNVDSGKGDSGHKFRVVKNCPNADSLKTAIEKHKERVKDPEDTKYKDKPIVITTASLEDVAISEAHEACLDPEKGGGTETVQKNPPSSSTIDTPNDPSPVGSSGKTGKSGRLNWREITNP